MRRTPILLSLVAAGALLAACGTGPADDPTTEPATDATTTEDPTTDPTTDTSTEPSSAPADEPADGAPDFPAGTEAQTADATDAALLLVDVRVAEHPGFDRIVLEFEGDGEPGYDVRYVDETSTQGQGEPIVLDGDALLQITAMHTMPDDMTGYYDGPKEIDPEADGVEAVYVDGTFEGQTIVVAGIDAAAASFRVFTLTEPSRLVVDVVDDDD